MTDQVTILREFHEVIEELLDFHFRGEKALDTQTAKLYERLLEADKLMRDRNFPEQSDKVKRLRDLFGVSLSTARADMIRAAELFNRINVVDLATSYRLLLGKIQQYERLCFETNNLKEGRHYLQLEKDMLDKLQEVADEGPHTFAPTINIYTDGENSSIQSALADRQTDKVAKLVMKLDLDDDIKEKTLNELGIKIR